MISVTPCTILPPWPPPHARSAASAPARARSQNRMIQHHAPDLHHGRHTDGQLRLHLRTRSQNRQSEQSQHKAGAIMAATRLVSCVCPPARAAGRLHHPMAPAQMDVKGEMREGVHRSHARGLQQPRAMGAARLTGAPQHAVHCNNISCRGLHNPCRGAAAKSVTWATTRAASHAQRGAPRRRRWRRRRQTARSGPG